MKTSNKNRKRVIIAAVLVLLAVFTLLAFDTALKVVHYDVTSKKVTGPVRIVFIADLHSCDYGEGQADLLGAVIEQQPDVVLLGGDIFDDALPNQNAITVVKTLSKEYPCYYVSGNHEYWSHDIVNIKQTIRDCGVSVLEGACEAITISGQTVNICGIDDAEIGEENMFDQLTQAHEQADTKLLTLLLAHRPEYIDTYLEYDFNLILSGHAHGGQFRIPGLINGLYAPCQGWFPKYAGGKYVFDEKTFIVSRGLSKESSRMPRIFNPPELVVIDIIPDDESTK